MKMTRLFPRAVLSLLLILPMPGARAIGIGNVVGGINTVTISAATAAAAPLCAHWMPIGACLWLYCGWSGCRVRVSLKVGHYNPDLVISAYNELGGNPWTEVALTLGTVQQTAAATLLSSLLGLTVDSAGNRTEGTHAGNRRDHRNMIFREADVIGHPVASLIGLLQDTGLICPAATTSFFPYFSSPLDALSWRTEIPETLYPASLIPGMRELGQFPIYTWGNIFPRTGWSTQTSEPKSAALAAQRAGDIVTRSGQPHVYWPVRGSPWVANDFFDRIDDWVDVLDDDGNPVLDDDGNPVQENHWRLRFYGVKVWPPPPLRERDANTGYFQMLYPNMTASCAVFGTNDLVGISDWGGGKVSSGGEYAWTLWRPYKCCKRKGQVYLGSVGIGG